MSHKITQRDAVLLRPIPETFDGKGWHGLGLPTPIINAESAKIVLWPYSFAQSGIMTDNGFLATGQRYVVSSDDGLPVGNAVGKNWNTPQNAELFELFVNALAGSGYEIVSVGTVDNREEFFIDAKANETMNTTHRTIAAFVGLHRFFGGRGPLIISGHSMVCQCANTTALFRSEAAKAEDSIRAKNCTNIMGKLDEIRKSIELAHGVAAEFAEAMKQAEAMPLKVDAAQRAFVGLIAGDNKELSMRGVGRVNRLVELFKIGAGNRGESVADFVNSVTDFFTHESTGSVDAADSKEDFLVKQYHSSEFGTARNFKARFVANAFQGDKVNRGFLPELAKIGKAVIGNTDKEVIAELAEV